MNRIKKVGNMIIGEGMPKICAPLTGATLSELLEEAKLVSRSAADLVEWRVDFFEYACDKGKVLHALGELKLELGGVPLIFSFRTAREGGEKDISLDRYISLNSMAIASGQVDIIDIELFQGKQAVEELVEEAKRHSVLTIISNHDFKKTPDEQELLERAEEAIFYGADLPKIAVMPEKEEDVLTVLKTNLQLKRKYPKQLFIMIAMGKLGVMSRLSGEVFGSAITFAAVKHASAPGQVTVEQVKAVLELIHDEK